MEVYFGSWVEKCWVKGCIWWWPSLLGRLGRGLYHITIQKTESAWVLSLFCSLSLFSSSEPPGFSHGLCPNNLSSLTHLLNAPPLSTVVFHSLTTLQWGLNCSWAKPWEAFQPCLNLRPTDTLSQKLCSLWDPGDLCTWEWDLCSIIFTHM